MFQVNVIFSLSFVYVFSFHFLWALSFFFWVFFCLCFLGFLVLFGVLNLCRELRCLACFVKCVSVGYYYCPQYVVSVNSCVSVWWVAINTCVSQIRNVSATSCVSVNRCISKLFAAGEWQHQESEKGVKHGGFGRGGSRTCCGEGEITHWAQRVAKKADV